MFIKLCIFCSFAAGFAQGDRLVQSIVSSIGDPLALLSANGGTKLSDILFAFDRSAMRQEEKAFFRTSSGIQRDYAGVFVSADRNADVVFLHMHGGFFSYSDRYDVSAWMLSLAKTAGKPFVSMQYPLNRQSGWTIEILRARTDSTLAAVNAVFPNAAVVVLGSSAGGTLALDLASRQNSSSLAAVIADSPNVCLRTLPSDFALSPQTCASDPPFDLMREDFFIFPAQDMCYYDIAAQTNVNVFALFPEYDIILPQLQFDRYMEHADPQNYCVDRFGLHSNAASAMGCISRVIEWLREKVPQLSTLTRAKYMGTHGTYALREMFGYTYQTFLPLEVSCPQLCATSTWDPLVWSLLKCGGGSEIVVPG